MNNTNELFVHIEQLEKRIAVLEANIERQAHLLDHRMKSFVEALGGMLIESAKTPIKQQKFILKPTETDEDLSNDTIICFRMDEKIYSVPYRINGHDVIEMSVVKGQPVLYGDDNTDAVTLIEKIKNKYNEDLKHFEIRGELTNTVNGLLDEKQVQLLLVNAWQC